MAGLRNNRQSRTSEP